MLKIGTTLILSEVELKHYKKLILSKYPCKEEVAYRKKIEEQKKIIEDQGHELYNQNKTIEFLKSELDKKKEPVKTSTIKLDDMAPLTNIDMHPSREEVCDMINKSLEEAQEARSRKHDEDLITKANYQTLKKEYGELKAENQILKRSIARGLPEEIVIDQSNESDDQDFKEESLTFTDPKFNKTIVLNKRQLDLKRALDQNEIEDMVKREIIREKYVTDTEKSLLKAQNDFYWAGEKYNELKEAYNNLFEECTALKASYDNLLDEQRSLKCNDERLNAAKLIIDALQKDNDDLKAKLSDVDRHAHDYFSAKNKEYEDLLEAYRELKGKYEEAVKDATLSMAEKQQLVDQTQHLRNDIDKHRIDENKYRNDAIKMASIILDVDILCEKNRKYLVIRNKKFRISDELYSAICSLPTAARNIASEYKKYINIEEFEFDDEE